MMDDDLCQNCGSLHDIDGYCGDCNYDKICDCEGPDNLMDVLTEAPE